MITLSLTFRSRQIWPTLIGLLLCCILVFQYMTLQRADGYLVIEAISKGDIKGYLRNWLYYFPVECVSIGIIVKILTIYQRYLKLYQLKLTPYNLLKYQLLFLPPIVLSIPIFSPITNLIRYLLFHGGDYSWSGYFPDYVFTGSMFLNYLLPVILFGYGYININLILDSTNYFQRQEVENQQTSTQDLSTSSVSLESQVQYNQMNSLLSLVEPEVHLNNLPTNKDIDQKQNSSIEKSVVTRLNLLHSIEVLDSNGQSCLAATTIYYFIVQEKIYSAQTASGLYTIRKTITELEKELDPISFYRINRGVIVNIKYVKNYSHWEYDKYIVRLTDNKTEFIMQRNRLKGLRERLTKQFC